MMKKLAICLILFVFPASAQIPRGPNHNLSPCPVGLPVTVTASGANTISTLIGITPPFNPLLCSNIVPYQVFRGASLIGTDTALNFIDRSGLTPSTAYTYTIKQNSITVGTATTSTLSASPVLYVDTFEQDAPVVGAKLPGWSADKPLRTYVTNAKSRAGSQSLYFNFPVELWNPTDNGLHGTVTQNPSNTQLVNATMGQNIWTGISIYLEKWDADLSSNPELFMQWHGSSGETGIGPGGCGAPPVSHIVHGNEFEIQSTYSDTNDTNNVHEHYLYTEPVANLVGQWIDWVMKINFDYTAGTVDVWRNGVHVLAYTGPNIYLCPATGSITFTTIPEVGSGLVFNGTAVTFVYSGATGNQVNLGDTLTATLTNLNTFLQGSADPQLVLFIFSLSGKKLSMTSTTYPGTQTLELTGNTHATLSGPALVGQSSVKGPLFNVGPYKWLWGLTSTQTSVRSMYADEFRQGDATAVCADVKPTGSAACAP